MLPAEQPARTMAPAASAAARARLGAGRRERDINIMPIRSRPDGNAKRRPAPPFHGKIAASSSNWGQVVCPQYDQSKVKAGGFTGDARPRPRQDAGASAKAYDASCGGYE
jgi:hypothetical protein